MDFLNIRSETEEEFKEIADILFNSYAIQTKDSLFRLTDIEFYWNSNSHKDNSTYERKHVDPNTGEWFFHYSGVDIALKNKNNNGFGGILIRGVFDIKNEKPYNGPLVCSMRLFSGISAFEHSEISRFIKYKFPRQKISTDKRKNLGKNATESGTDKKNYRFYIEPK
jgi:hypothetical protein